MRLLIRHQQEESGRRLGKFDKRCFVVFLVGGCNRAHSLVAKQVVWIDHLRIESGKVAKKQAECIVFRGQVALDLTQVAQDFVRALALRHTRFTRVPTLTYHIT